MITNSLSRTRSIKAPWQVLDSPRLFTIGYEGLSVNDFLHQLITNDVRILIDVRYNPISRKPGFSKSSLRENLDQVGIEYFHIPKLGIPSAIRKAMKSNGSFEELFSYYEKEILAFNYENIDLIKQITTDYSSVALMCFEADYHSCHRHKITDLLSGDRSFMAEMVHL